MFEKESSNIGGVDGFETRDENHSLHKPMVDHDQNRVKIRGEQEICDHIAQDLLEWAGGGGRDRVKPRDSQVSVNLVGLASSAASHESLDKGGQTGPPVVTLNQVNGVEISAMASRQGAVQEAYQILVSWFQNVEASLEVQGTFHKHPVVTRCARKEGSLPRHGVNSILNQQIGRSEISNPFGQPHFQGTYQNVGDSGQHGNGGVVE